MQLRMRGAERAPADRRRRDLAVIPNRRNATKKVHCRKRFCRLRHKIENFFCSIKDWRRIATRYDKLVLNFLAAADLVDALYWIKL
jgi:putative transposase